MMKRENEIETFYPANKEEWRQWLETHHRSRKSVWLLQYKKKAQIATITWSEAVDEALCYGWIDSTRKSAGNDSFIQFFSPRKPKSAWSKINKDKVQRLVDQGLMTSAGYKSIETAKENGSWRILDDVETLKVPKDLNKAFKARPGAKAYFTSLSRSARKNMLQWLVLAKRPETRQKRIDEIAELAARQRKPKQF